MPDEFRIGVLSDSHGDFRSIERALGTLGRLDALIHAGDYYRDSERLTRLLDIPVIGVVGNCDAQRQPQDELIELAGQRFFVTHGHHYGVKTGTESVVKEARRRRAEVVVFGHTHVPVMFVRHSIVFLNPGSTHEGRNGAGPSCALVKLHGAQIEAAFFTLTNLPK